MGSEGSFGGGPEGVDVSGCWDHAAAQATTARSPQQLRRPKLRGSRSRNLRRVPAGAASRSRARWRSPAGFLRKTVSPEMRESHPAAWPGSSGYRWREKPHRHAGLAAPRGNSALVEFPCSRVKPAATELSLQQTPLSVKSFSTLAVQASPTCKCLRQKIFLPPTRSQATLCGSGDSENAVPPYTACFPLY